MKTTNGHILKEFTGRHHTQATKDKISNSLKGRKNPNRKLPVRYVFFNVTHPTKGYFEGLTYEQASDISCVTRASLAALFSRHKSDVIKARDCIVERVRLSNNK